jgi:hypothetical protein
MLTATLDCDIIVTPLKHNGDTLSLTVLHPVPLMGIKWAADGVPVVTKMHIFMGNTTATP